MTDRTDVTEALAHKALGHPMRHRLLFALGRAESTISQLAASLDTNKGGVAHHLKVLHAAGLVEVARSAQVRGGTEVYYRRVPRRVTVDDPATTTAVLTNVAAEVATAAETPVLVLRSVHLTAAQLAAVTEALDRLAEQTEDAGPDNPQYRLLLGLYRPE
jgi:DNA-binding transcriptional ArsR family regulator